jgi:phosphohistidine phosphatase SixA
MSLKKNVIGIRHGEALHNVVGKIYGTKVYEQFEDTTLTTNGMRQAMEATVLQPDLVLVSPLTRTLQTATLMFPNVKMVALECLKEYPQHTEICNRRSPISTIGKLFPHVDFSDCQTNVQDWPNDPPTPDDNIKIFYNKLDTFEEVSVAVVTHSTWLKYFIMGKVESEPEIEHCKPIKLR